MDEILIIPILLILLAFLLNIAVFIAANSNNKKIKNSWLSKLSHGD